MTTTDKPSSAIDQMFNENIQWCKNRRSQSIPIARLENILTFLRHDIGEIHQAETKAAYSKGASDMLEKVKAAHFKTYDRYGLKPNRYTAFELDILDDVDELLSQYKQGAVEEYR